MVSRFAGGLLLQLLDDQVFFIGVQIELAPVVEKQLGLVLFPLPCSGARLAVVLGDTDEFQLLDLRQLVVALHLQLGLISKIHGATRRFRLAQIANGEGLEVADDVGVLLVVVRLVQEQEGRHVQHGDEEEEFHYLLR